MSGPPTDDPSSVVDLISQSPPVDCSKPYDTSTLAGKTILITGGASGFGAAFARHWARHGAHLVLGDINDRAGEELVAELRSSPSTAPDQVIFYQHCDVTSWTDQLALFRAAIAASPNHTIDTVVAGAGIIERGNPLAPSATSPVFDHPANLDASHPPPPPPPLKVLAVNLTGVMYTTHLALYYLSLNPPPSTTTTSSSSSSSTPPRAARDRHLLLISSIAGLIPLPGQTEYTASKHAVMGLFRALRATVPFTTITTTTSSSSNSSSSSSSSSSISGSSGIRVNALTPYFVDTPLLPAAGLALLAGAATAALEDVVDAATRLVADEGIRGRALLVGPKIRVVDVEGEGDWQLVDGGRLRVVEGEARTEGERRQAVWEVYGHDYERVEVFVWRYLWVLNLMRRLRGQRVTGGIVFATSGIILTNRSGVEEI
ncbi:845a6f07-faaa-4390-a74b-690c5a99fc95 [Thermothielavioides terrestris]|uniref:845a6f07-faaa-4390-a74b-690c5a99fc95 n=1 Tax=Thermothielavioides terrestris TaxID=2587410 RepID=A0A3S4AJQ6_9PEZI|nr:845a6f07-faaa-4390-a74b-690c5a99fc95 [Thermothielavioides terrestris]